MCTGGLLTEWSGVTRLDDVTEDTLALMFAVKPAPGACASSTCPVTFVLGVRQACRGWRVVLQLQELSGHSCQGPHLHESAALSYQREGQWTCMCTACQTRP